MSSVLMPPQLTKEQAANKLKAVVFNGIRGLYRNMLGEFNKDFGMIWNNPDGLSQAEALAALGADGAEVFRLAALLKDALNNAQPNSITATTPDITVNENGTVILAVV